MTLFFRLAVKQEEFLRSNITHKDPEEFHLGMLYDGAMMEVIPTSFRPDKELMRTRWPNYCAFFAESKFETWWDKIHPPTRRLPLEVVRFKSPYLFIH